MGRDIEKTDMMSGRIYHAWYSRKQKQCRMIFWSFDLKYATLDGRVVEVTQIGHHPDECPFEDKEYLGLVYGDWVL